MFKCNYISSRDIDGTAGVSWRAIAVVDDRVFRFEVIKLVPRKSRPIFEKVVLQLFSVVDNCVLLSGRDNLSISIHQPALGSRIQRTKGKHVTSFVQREMIIFFSLINQKMNYKSKAVEYFIYIFKVKYNFVI